MYINNRSDVCEEPDEGLAGISRLQVHLLHSTPPALKSTSLLSMFPRFSRSTPRKIFTPRLLCSTPQVRLRFSISF